MSRPRLVEQLNRRGWNCHISGRKQIVYHESKCSTSILGVTNQLKYQFYLQLKDIVHRTSSVFFKAVSNTHSSC